jgi:hypothetical protein
LGDVEGAALRRNEITDTAAEGIIWDGPGFTKHGTIEGNLLRRTSAAMVILNNCSSVAILNNRIEEPAVGGGAFPGFGIVLAAAAPRWFRRTPSRPPRSTGSSSGKAEETSSSTTSSGVAAATASISTRRARTLWFLNNVASGNGTAGLPSGGDGLLVEGSQNLIERNLLNTNAGFGLHFCIPRPLATTPSVATWRVGTRARSWDRAGRVAGRLPCSLPTPATSRAAHFPTARSATT